MARLRDIVFDCRHPAPLARFWASVLDGFAVAPYDDAELSRLRGLGVDDPEDDPTVLVESPDSGVRLWFQRVPEARTVKNRVHLDLVCDDREGEIARLLGLGATRGADHHQPGHSWTVMADPEGNDFCIAGDGPDPPGSPE